MKFSVITAVYNRQNTIARALLSIKEQTYENVEVVVVDGGSSDGTQEVVKTIIDDGDIFISETDKGIYDALNKGINASTGDIICFLHSDDIYKDKHCLSVVANYFNKEIDIVYGNVSFFKKNDVTKLVRVYKPHKLNIKNLTWGKMPAHPAIFIRKEIYIALGSFNIKYRIAGDYEFLCRMMTTMNCKSIHIPKLIVRMQLGGISTGGLRNTLLLNKEVLHACRDNRLKTNILMLLSKYPSKVLEFFCK
jgi:glycosyltransferase involved in cell wall biosynthesis